jgi:hypothetical protein
LFFVIASITKGQYLSTEKIPGGLTSAARIAIGKAGEWHD